MVTTKCQHVTREEVPPPAPSPRSLTVGVWVTQLCVPALFRVLAGLLSALSVAAVSQLQCRLAVSRRQCRQFHGDGVAFMSHIGSAVGFTATVLPCRLTLAVSLGSQRQ